MDNETLWPSPNAPLPPISDEEFAEFEYYLKLEEKWKESLPDLSFRQWLEIFPDKTMAARRGLKAKLQELKTELREIQTRQDDYYNNVISKAHFKEQPQLKEDSDRDFDVVRVRTSSKIKTIMFNLSYVDELEGKAPAKQMGGVSEMDIAKAKEISILNFYPGKVRKHGHLAVGLCPFHNEKTGSFTIYMDQNTFWCYGCQSGGTVIDFLMKQNGVDFLTAVKTLLK